MLFKRVDSVGGAGRIILTAGRLEWRNKFSVNFHKKNKNIFHYFFSFDFKIKGIALFLKKVDIQKLLQSAAPFLAAITRS